jgi:hypothetical protein
MVLGIFSAVVSGAGVVLAAEGASRDDTAGESPSEPAEGERHRLQSLLLGATPEERAQLEAERVRLSAAARAFGTDPTAIVTYYQLVYGHSEFTNNLRLDAATAEARLALTPNWLLRVTVPYVWADLNGPRGFTTNGASDTTVRTGGRLYASPNVALFIGTDALFPTASNKLLGTGKYTLGPGGAVAVPLPRLRSLLYVLIQNFNSVGGDPSRANVSYMQVQTQVNTIWSEKWWTTVGGTWDMDWNNNRKTTMNLQGEVGYQFVKGWNAFAGAGAGVVGRDTFLGLDWTVQAGVRWVIQGSLFSKRLLEEFPRK